jgi:hypothetical protein
VKINSESGEISIEGAAFGRRTGARADLDSSFLARAQNVVDEHVRDAYGAAFRVAALVTLLAIPFSLTMRRRPGEVASAEVPAPAHAVAG